MNYNYKVIRTYDDVWDILPEDKDLLRHVMADYLMQEYGYDEQGDVSHVLSTMEAHKDIFLEFLNCIKTGNFCGKDGSKVEVAGYTAERLSSERNLSPLGAYMYMSYISDNPDINIENFLGIVALCLNPAKR